MKYLKAQKGDGNWNEARIYATQVQRRFRNLGGEESAVENRSMRIIGLGLVLVLLSACAAVVVGTGAGAGTYAYIKGELQREYAAPLDLTYAATTQALKALEIRVAESKKDQLGGEIDARRADDTRIKIALEPKEGRRTLVKIRVGVFGDREASERIGNEIQKRL